MTAWNTKDVEIFKIQFPTSFECQEGMEPKAIISSPKVFFKVFWREEASTLNCLFSSMIYPWQPRKAWNCIWGSIFDTYFGLKVQDD